MKIVSVSENKKIEKRIAVTPDVVKKYINLGFEISLPENYGLHLGIDDNEFKELGADIIKDEKELITSSDIIIQLGLLEDDKLSLIKENQILVGILNPYDNKKKIDDLTKKILIYFLLNYCQELQGRNLWIYFLHKQTLLVIKL